MSEENTGLPKLGVNHVAFCDGIVMACQQVGLSPEQMDIVMDKIAEEVPDWDPIFDLYAADMEQCVGVKTAAEADAVTQVRQHCFNQPEIVYGPLVAQAQQLLQGQE